MSGWTDTVQALAGLATVGVAGYGAWLARKASSDWRSTLKQERADTALLAAADLQARVGRMVAAARRSDKQAFWIEYDATHRARASYAAALIACSRYFTGLDENTPSEIYTSLLQIEDICNRDPRAYEAAIPWAPTDGLFAILDRVRAETHTLITQLRVTLGQA